MIAPDDPAAQVHGRGAVKYVLLSALVLAIGLAVVGWVSRPARARSDTCVLDLVLPPGAHVKLDGRDYGAKTRFKFSRLRAGKIYRSNLEVTLAEGAKVVLPLEIEAGRVVRRTIGAADKKADQPKPAQPESPQPALDTQTALTGVWKGTYYYPAGSGQPSVAFQIQIVQEGDRVNGYIQEPNTFGDPSSPWLRASITGRYDERTRSLSWTKTYDGTGNVSHSVSYWGRVSADGKRIEDGGWQIPGSWSGRFELEKKGSQALDEDKSS